MPATNTPSPFTLGPFEVFERIGRGGMAEVWRARTRQPEAHVAIKVLMGARAQDEAYRSAFRAEVRAVARLDHPGIVNVYDTGEVPPGTLSAPPEVAGGVYLAMELLDHGSLRNRPPRNWSELRDALSALLDALAHAHARGVVHRDLKPSNVLLAAPTADHPGPLYRGCRAVITDFGIARPSARWVQGEALWGTPHYMAPEQFTGGGRDIGPWTDLYALGCMCFSLAQGTPPFRTRDPARAMRAHMLHPVPKLAPRFPVPEGLQEWLHTLLAKAAADRFQFARDAQLALELLGDAPGPQQSPAPSDDDDDPSHTVPLELIADADAVLGTMPNFAGQDERDSAPASETWRLPGEAPDEPDEPDELAHVSSPFPGPPAAGPGPPEALRPPPSTWRVARKRPPGRRLGGAGLSLYGLRRVPFVDRDEIRDALWADLLQVSASRRPRAIVLRGAAGTGKSRLAGWLVERAHELAVALNLTHRFGPVARPTDPLARMATTYLRMHGLDRDALRGRVRGFLAAHGLHDPILAEDISELAVAADPQTQGWNYGRPSERRWAFRRFLEVASRGRPVILWLDEVQWGGEGIELARALLAAADEPDPPDLPVLVLLTARDDALAARPMERAAVESLASEPGCHTVEVGPLPEQHRTELVEHLLGLSGELVAQVAARTEGNPLFAVQLVQDWVDRGVLVPAPGGFTLRAGAAASLPDNLHEVWQTRIEQLIEGQGADTRGALEMASTLGLEVNSEEWADACAQAGMPLPAKLEDALQARRLATRIDGGWAFAHGMLRESLERSAREGGRYARLHRACARMLRARDDPATSHHAERIGLHFLEGGDLEAALEPLLAGAQARMNAGRYPLALGLLRIRERALDTLGAAEADERRVSGWVMRSQVFAQQGLYELSERWGTRAGALSREHGWRLLEARALVRVSFVEQFRGEIPEAISHLERALDLISPEDAPGYVAACLHGLGHIARRVGDLHRARSLLTSAAGLYDELGDGVARATSLVALAAVANSGGAHDEAEGLLKDALVHYEAVHHRTGQADCYNGLGESARFMGKLDEAEANYRRAIALYDSGGFDTLHIPRINLGLTLLARHEHAQAQRQFLDTLQPLQRAGSRAYLAVVYNALACCAAGLGDWDLWVDQWTTATQLLDETGMVDADVARPAEQAAEFARRAGRVDDARAALHLAHAQWATLGRGGRAAMVAEELAKIGAMMRLRELD